MCLLNMIGEPTDTFDMRDIQWVELNSVSSLRIGLFYLFHRLQAEFFVARYERRDADGCQRNIRGHEIRSIGTGARKRSAENKKHNQQNVILTMFDATLRIHSSTSEKGISPEFHQAEISEHERIVCLRFE